MFGQLSLASFWADALEFTNTSICPPVEYESSGLKGQPFCVPLNHSRFWPFHMFGAIYAMNLDIRSLLMYPNEVVLESNSMD